jgi:hypothetical protein
MENKKTFTCYFPLWGFGFDSEEAGIIGGKVFGCKPYQKEWQNILKSDVLKEYAAYRSTVVWEVEPQFCLCITYPLSIEESLYDGVERHQEEIYQQIRDALLALRLFRKGWIMDPYLVEYSFMDNSNFILRSPGPYRQIFMAGFDNNFPEFYVLDPKELSYTQDEKKPLRKIFDLIAKYRESGGNQSVEIAIENFGLSYSLPGNISWEQKISFLFTALDAMLGGMSLHRRNNRYYLRDTEMEVFFRERIQQVLSLCGNSSAEEESKWVDSLRQLRNPIAHGSRSGVEKDAEESFDRFQDVIRNILKHYMAFSVRFKAQKTQIAGILGMEPTTGLTEMYNKALEISHLNITIPDGLWENNEVII